MNWRNTNLIFRRELCDQWRDRRTLFTIVVMPLVLYPLLGMALLQTAQFMRQDAARVLWVGPENLPGDPPLVAGGRWASGLKMEDAENIVLATASWADSDAGQRIQSLLAAGDDVSDRQAMQRFMLRQACDVIVLTAPRDESGEGTLRAPRIVVLANSASDQSALAAARVVQIVDRWKTLAMRKTLRDLAVNEQEFQEISLVTTDVAPSGTKKAAIWVKLLPFIMLMWALTGAFYPAIDLCAGEKERGTLETLLSSPVSRSDVVAGKLLTVTTFSITTALLNLLSMTITGLLVLGQLSRSGGGALPAEFGFPPLGSLAWLVAGLIPIAALFSSLALALASFARSSREGQYYLVPLLMSLLPLMMLSMFPSARLDLGTSLIPVTGMLLLLKNLVTGQYAIALQFAGPVLAMTLVCCWLAARWAVWQFNNESVLFRSGDQFGLGVWLRHLIRDRGMLPTLGEAVLCGVIILVIKFFVGLSAELSLTFAGFARQVVISQVATIALPAVLMALFLTRGPLESLKLGWPRWSFVPAAILLAILLHPGFTAISQCVLYLYPPTPGLENLNVAVKSILDDAPGTLAIIAVIAIAPAFCEELAFRGFILSGLQSIRGRWTAILASAMLFGIAHGILQQSIMATLVGVVLGIIAVQTRSILPCIAFHATHNALPVLIAAFPAHRIGGSWLAAFIEVNEAGGTAWTPAAMCVLPGFGVALLAWLWRYRHEQPEPRLAAGQPVTG